MTQNVGLGSASGYGSIHDTPLATKGYHSHIIARGGKRILSVKSLIPESYLKRLTVTKWLSFYYNRM